MNDRLPSNQTVEPLSEFRPVAVVADRDHGVFHPMPANRVGGHRVDNGNATQRRAVAADVVVKNPGDVESAGLANRFNHDLRVATRSQNPDRLTWLCHFVSSSSLDIYG